MREPSPSPRVALGNLAPALGDTCGDYLSQYRARIEDAVRRGEGGVAVARQNSKSLDGLLSALCCACHAASGAGPDGGLALVAVGGYGREVVGVQSDVDVLFLCDDPLDERVQAIAEGLLYPLWDLGLEIGHAVRGVKETLDLARKDIRTATTLLDLRLVAGDAKIFAELKRGARRHVFEPCLGEFLGMLEADTKRRHERFGDSLYLLEPEVKLGRGGLRDMDVAGWAMGARWAVRGSEEYVRIGALLAREAEGLEGAREFFWRTRNLLHLRAGRRQDRLTFADQEDIAEQLGFVDGITLGVEQFMQAYYRHAQTVAQTAERVLSRARPPTKLRRASPVDLGDGTMLFGGQVTLRDSSELASDPSLALRVYAQAAQRGIPVYRYARDAIARATDDAAFCLALRESEAASQLFLEALMCTTPIGARRLSVLGMMHEVGLMTAMIPEFEPLLGRVQHDVYHVYTVDVHSVRAVARLAALCRGDLVESLPVASRLAAEASGSLTLFVGLLLHDVGKAHGKDHSRKGAAMAGPIAERLGLSAEEVATVVWLVEEHLSLYHWALRRDTSDPATIDEIAKSVETVERLRDLYLLTVSDISTTNPTAMTSWKAQMFESLHAAVRAALTGDANSQHPDEIREDVKTAFEGDENQEELEAFVEEMPDRYVLGTPVEAIRAHAPAAQDRGERAIHVVHAPGPSPEVAELSVIGDDQEGLLAAVAAVLASHRLSVVSAEVHTRKRADESAEAFDVFHVRRDGPGEGPIVDDQICAGIAADLRQIVSGAVQAEELVASIPRGPVWAERQVPDVKTEIIIDNDISAEHTVIDVFTRDRIGLLYEIAEAIHEQGLSIAVSKIATEGARAIDAFYVHDADGKITDGERVKEIERRLRASLDAYHARSSARE